LGVPNHDAVPTRADFVNVAFNKDAFPTRRPLAASEPMIQPAKTSPVFLA
jgi:hypothetical protein